MSIDDFGINKYFNILNPNEYLENDFEEKKIINLKIQRLKNINLLKSNRNRKSNFSKKLKGIK